MSARGFHISPFTLVASFKYKFRVAGSCVFTLSQPALRFTLITHVASRENVHVANGTVRGWAYALYGLVVGNARTQRPSAHLASSNDPRLAWAEDAVAANVG